MNQELDPGRQALAKYVREARLKKFKTVDAARRAAGVARGTWEAVERGDIVRDYTMSKIDDVFGWPTGRCERIIATHGNVQPLSVELADDDSDPDLTVKDGDRNVEVVIFDKFGDPVPKDNQVAFAEAVRQLVASNDMSLAQVIAEAVRQYSAERGADPGLEWGPNPKDVPDVLRAVAAGGGTLEEAVEADRLGALARADQDDAIREMDEKKAQKDKKPS